MRAMFLKRNYIEKSKKSGRSMVVLDVFELPRLRDDGTGEMRRHRGDDARSGAELFHHGRAEVRYRQRLRARRHCRYQVRAGRAVQSRRSRFHDEGAGQSLRSRGIGEIRR